MPYIKSNLQQELFDTIYTNDFDFATNKKKLTTLISLIKNENKDLNFFSSSGFPLAYIAALTESSDLIDFLIGNGMNLELKNDKNDDALFIAAARSDVPTAAMLLKHGARGHMLCSTGMTAVDMAIENNNYAVLALLFLSQNKEGINGLDALKSRQGSLFLALQRFYSNAPEDARKLMLSMTKDPTNGLGCVFKMETKWRVGRKNMSTLLAELEKDGVSKKDAAKFPKKKTYHPAMNAILGLELASNNMVNNVKEEKEVKKDNKYNIKDDRIKVMF